MGNDQLIAALQAIQDEVRTQGEAISTQVSELSDELTKHRTRDRERHDNLVSQMGDLDERIQKVETAIRPRLVRQAPCDG